MYHDRLLTGGTALSRPDARLIRGVRATDALMTYDRSTIDSTGSFLVGQLERLDPILHEPLLSYTWSRDIDLRTDVTIADDISSYTLSAYGGTGGINPNGKNWIGKLANAIPSVSLDIGKVTNPLHAWGAELSYTVYELAAAQKLGKPIDAQKIEVIQTKWNMDIDEQVYTGDSSLPNCYGMCNNPTVAVSTAPAAGSASPTGNTGSTAWADKTPVQILSDINTIIYNAYQASGWSVIPDRILLPPQKMNYLVSTLVSTAGNQSILKFLLENNMAAQNGRALTIQPVKWLIGRGASGTPGVVGTQDRMIAYSKEQQYVRFPMTDLRPTPVEYRSLYQIVTYYGKLGQVEFVRPETAAYLDGI